MKDFNSFLRIALVIALCSYTLTSNAQNVGVGIANPLHRLQVEGDSNSVLSVLKVTMNKPGTFDIPSIEAFSKPLDGWGVGGHFTGGYRGVYGHASGGGYGGTTYGVSGISTGSGTGIRVGVYGDAYGGETNWAGYFVGQGKFTGQLSLDNGLSATGDIITTRNVYAQDTVKTSWLRPASTAHTLWVNSGRDVYLTIDDEDDEGYAAAFFVRDGDGNNCFGADEHGNARTYGNHYIDSAVGIGTQFPSQKLDVDHGNLMVQGTNSFQANGDAGIVYLGGIHHYIKGEYGFGVKLGTYAVGDAFVIKEITGNVGVGTTTPANGYKLSVDGKIIGEELKIQDSGSWPDYVFADDYKLMPLEQLKTEIGQYGHLPGIPSAEHVEREGILVGDMQKRMMEKIEELTLYVIDLDERVKELTEENNMLKSRLEDN